jgi:transposase
MELRPDAIWLATAPVDTRTGIDGLSLHVQQALGKRPSDGTAYVFANRRRTRLKLVCWDGNGVWMCLRRLHRGQFVWPAADATSWQIDERQWQWLVAEVDWERVSTQAPRHWSL